MTDTPSHRWNKTLMLCVGLAGVLGFFAGRFSIHQPVAVVDSNITASTSQPVTTAKTVASPQFVESRGEKSGNAVADTSGWNEKKWSDLASQRGSPARNAALAAMLEKLAAAEPDRAMALAKAEGNLKLREDLVQASLHGWARTAPTNAANWALALADPNDRERALSTVFDGIVATNPEEALRVGNLVIAQNPNDSGGYGTRLIDAFCAVGDFEKATQMASSGGDQTRSGWMGEAFSKWAQFQPEQAANAADAITDPDTRIQALHGIVGGWSEADPAGLVDFVTQLPDGSDRDSLISQSLERWAKVDPTAASQWMNNRDPALDLDQGMAAVATMDSLKPDVAVGWAESIVDPKTRSETLVTVLRNWLPDDLSAAESFFDSTQNLLPEDRKEVAGVIAALKGQSQTAAQ